MWLAEMDTEHFEFKALGRNENAAKRRVVAAFKLHLKQCGLTFTKWKESTQCKTLEDYYGINTIELVSDGMWRDYERLKPEEVK